MCKPHMILFILTQVATLVTVYGVCLLLLGGEEYKDG